MGILYNEISINKEGRMHIYDENGKFLAESYENDIEKIKQQYESKEIYLSESFLGEKAIIKNNTLIPMTRLEKINAGLEFLQEGEFIENEKIKMTEKLSNFHSWNTEEKEWKLSKSEYIIFLKKQIELCKEKIIENGFEYEINEKQVIQKCREKDKSNILGTIEVLKETKQSNIDWKFNDENNNDVIEKITPGNLKEMLIRGAQLTSKGIETEQKLFYTITKLTDKQLEKFNVEDEFLKLMEE